jgi:hypothetical protein
MHQGVVLLGRAEVRPDSDEPLDRPKLGTGDVLVVVPEELAVPGGPVERADDQDQAEGEQPPA